MAYATVDWETRLSACGKSRANRHARKMRYIDIARIPLVSVKLLLLEVPFVWDGGRFTTQEM